MPPSAVGAGKVVVLAAFAAVVLSVAWIVIMRATRPAGGGLGSLGPRGATDYAAARARMVDALRAERLITSDRVADAMRGTERHLFVPRDLWDVAYVDTPLPIGEDQTISAPSVVALMTEELRAEPTHVVLEVGTGSGYQAAVLAPLVSHVYTIEIVPALAATGEARLRDLGYENVTVRCGDGYQGWPEHAPFDGIIVTCAPDEPPQPLLDQLREGGRMVIPVGEDRGPQWLCVLSKRDGRIEKTRTVPVQFVPMTGEAQQR